MVVTNNGGCNTVGKGRRGVDDEDEQNLAVIKLVDLVAQHPCLPIVVCHSTCDDLDSLCSFLSALPFLSSSTLVSLKLIFFLATNGGAPNEDERSHMIFVTDACLPLFASGEFPLNTHLLINYELSTKKNQIENVKNKTFKLVILEEVLLKNAIEHLGQGFVGFKQRAIGYVLVEPFTSFLVESGWAANRSVDCEAQNAIPKSKHTSFVQDQNQRHHHHFDGEVVMHASLGFVWEILVAMVVPMVVQNKAVTRLCKERVIVTVNGLYPGPRIDVREGDAVVVHVINKSPYNITIHWHGVFQLFSAWADGPEYITQCNIRPQNSYTYKFNVIQQEGTLWWHAHSGVLRATVHGAFIIHPRSGLFPFPKPHKQVPIILGDWYDGNIVDIYQQVLLLGDVRPSAAYTINGLPGDLYNCSRNQMFKLKVKPGKTYLLRMINAAFNNNLFVKIANHSFTVVAMDASYIEPYVTDIITIAPGQTADVLFKADQPIGSYYMAASPYVVGQPEALFDTTTTRGIVAYEGYTTSLKDSKPIVPLLPPFNATPIAHKFFSNITSLVGAPHWAPVPLEVDQHMFITININLERCPKNGTCQGVFGQKFSASMNNESFVHPVGKGYSMLEASFYNVSGVYTTDFPDKPPIIFDFTNPKIALDTKYLFTPPKSNKVKKLKFNSTVEVVFQNTQIMNAQSHPMHLHGFSFHVLAQDFGNFNYTKDKYKFNLVNPIFRNTIAVPAGGWAVIRFKANNPGMWFVHCHVDDHQLWGLDMVFEVENGPTPSTSLPPPPADLPKC
ncbi:hypothetical protein JHK82_018536 [Glycine max]|nr:hypothetical protein JHK86_018565 [Glycine max]KAG5142841.1 hypothetical protein JHK82_018536 [Glycine max]